MEEEMEHMIKMEKDYEIRIPLLEPINNILEVLKDYQKLIDDVDFIVDNYNCLVLDNFEASLDKKDKRLELLNNKYFMKSNEENYINTISEIFFMNNNCCVIDTNLLNFNYDYFLGTLNCGIDIKYQYILLHQYIKLNTFNNKYFYIKNVNLLKIFIIFGLRDNRLNNFIFFPKDNSFIFINYDQVFPIFNKNENILRKYALIAKNNNLYIR
jgi:hypothetical protein